MMSTNQYAANLAKEWQGKSVAELSELVQDERQRLQDIFFWYFDFDEIEYPFETEDEAVELANCTRYGLCSGLWTKSFDRAMAVSRRLRSGNVWVNHYTGFAPECETGGYKESGLDRAAGVDGFLKYTEIKHINMDFAR